MQFGVGTYPLTLQVMDLQSNVYNCTISFVVLAQVPAPPLTVVCPTNKTVECGSGWSFDSPDHSFVVLRRDGHLVGRGAQWERLFGSHPADVADH